MHAGDVIKILRKKNQMTQEELAEQLGVQKSSIQKYECGKVQNLKLEKIQLLCKIFKITPYAFVFPQNWEQVHIPQNNTNLFFEQSRKFFELNEEGVKKIMSYIDDISQIEKYRRENGQTASIHQRYHK